MSSGGHNEVKFKSAILALSTSGDWDEAKAEWDLHFVYIDSTNPDRACECEHSPIRQICVIKNRKNSSSTEVGNVCVRRFLRLLSNRIFSVLKRLQSDPQKSLNPAALDLFRDRGAISHAECEEYKEYWRKRTTLSDEQKEQKAEINARVLAYFVKETAALIGKAQAAGIDKIRPQRLP
jgi:hypothetical protein